MKEILELYYKIKIDYYTEYENSILFCVDGIYYLFCKTEYDEEYLKLLLKLIYELSNKIRLHDFVYNIYGNIKSEEYVLLKINVLNYEVDFDEVKRFMVPVSNSFYNNYVLLEDRLIEKIDLLENTCDDYYAFIYEIIVYNLKKYKFDSRLVLSHRIFKLNSYDFYNPLNICIDLYWRDISSYIRFMNDDELLLKSLYNFFGSDYDYNYFFSRMILPFDYKYNIDYERYLLKMEKLFGLNYFVWLKKE